MKTNKSIEEIYDMFHKANKILFEIETALGPYGKDDDDGSLYRRSVYAVRLELGQVLFSIKNKINWEASESSKEAKDDEENEGGISEI